MKRQSIVMIGTSIASILLLAGCGGGGTNGNSTKQQAGSSPLQVSIMTVEFATTPPGPDSPIQKAIEKATNSKLNIQWVSANNYDQKLNVVLASGNIPDIVYIDNPFSDVFRNMVKEGAFWDITPYIKDYPNLTKDISPTAWTLTKMQDGKNYGIPRPRPSEGDTWFIIRKDWLDRYGLKVPTTTDQLYQVLKTFKDKEADQSGKHDTVPFSVYIDPNDQNLGSLGYIESCFTHANGMWKLQNGKLEFTAFMPEERQALLYMKKLYDEQLIPQDFATIPISQAKDLFMSGRAGMIVDKAGTMQNYMPQLEKVDPKVKDTDFYPLSSINGYNPKGPGFAGILAIPKSVPESKMKQILALLNRWMEPDVFNLERYGIKGRDYKVENGKIVVNTDQYMKDDAGDFEQIVYVADPYGSSYNDRFPDNVKKLYKKIQDDRAKNSVADVSVGLYSPTGQKILPELEKQMNDLKVKIILGQQPISAWDSYVKQLKSNPDVQKMITEMNKAYQQRLQASH